MDSENNETAKKRGPNEIKYFLILLVFVFMITCLSSPLKEDKITHISNNQTLGQIVENLKKDGIINNPSFFNLIGKSLNLKIKTGDYLFKKNSSFFVVLYQLATSDHKIAPIKITIPEGLNNEKISDILTKKLNDFNKIIFLEKAERLEGQLFPDSYFFFPLATEEEIIKELNDTFKMKIGSLKPEINNSGKTLNEILIMASILEGEANGENDNKMISGILWKRLSINMPLQVDVDKETYKEKGLPEKPLNNPGLNSIKAALYPEKSIYLYYLHDKNGNVYYAKNYEEHKKNIILYLK